MARPTTGKTTKQSIEGRIRSQKALSFRLAGLSYRQIATELGFKEVSGAYRSVRRAMDQLTADNAEDLRALESERLDAMLFGIWKAARSGNVQAIDRVIRIMERRAKLHRLDPPEQRELSGPGGGPISVDDARALLLDRLERNLAESDADEGAGSDRYPTG